MTPRNGMKESATPRYQVVPATKPVLGKIVNTPEGMCLQVDEPLEKTPTGQYILTNPDHSTTRVILGSEPPEEVQSGEHSTWQYRIREIQ